MGHAYMIILVMLCQTLVYREVTRLFMLTDIKAKATDETRERDVWSKTLSWYFFAVANYFLYGESIIYYFKVYSFSSQKPHEQLIDKSSACRVRGREPLAVRDKSPYRQLLAVHHRLHGLRHVSPKRLLPTTIRPLLLGAHVASPSGRLLALHHEQHPRGPHLVLGPGVARYLQ